MDVAVSTSDLHAEGSLIESTSAEMSPVARQAKITWRYIVYKFRELVSCSNFEDYDVKTSKSTARETVYVEHYTSTKLDNECCKGRIPRRRHRHRLPRENPRRHVRHARLKSFMWQAERHADILATILVNCEDVGEDIGVGVGVVECEL